MMIAGFSFKASAAPFHMWTPDAYQGAPTPVTAFMASATKVAALVVMFRVLTTAFPGEEHSFTSEKTAAKPASAPVVQMPLPPSNEERPLKLYSVPGRE